MVGKKIRQGRKCLEANDGSSHDLPLQDLPHVLFRLLKTNFRGHFVEMLRPPLASELLPDVVAAIGGKVLGADAGEDNTAEDEGVDSERQVGSADESAGGDDAVFFGGPQDG